MPHTTGVCYVPRDLRRPVRPLYSFGAGPEAYVLRPDLPPPPLLPQIVRWSAPAFVLALSAGRAEAVCTMSACDATTITSNAACCTAASCTIDGTLTVTGPTCTF